MTTLLTAHDRVVLDQSALFAATGYTPHPGQRRIHSSEARFNVSVCGRRFGKSEIGGHKLEVEAFYTAPKRQALLDAGKRREFWIVGPEYSDSEKEFRVLYNALKRLEVPFDKPGTYNNPGTGEMRISLWDGTFVVQAKSAKHPETLVGEGLSGLVVAEAAKVKEKVWLRFLRSTLNDFRGWADFTTTPEGKNWIYDLWQRGQDPAQSAWASFRMPSWMNPYVYPLGATPEGLAEVRRLVEQGSPVTDAQAAALGVDPEIAQLLSDLTPEAFGQEIGADFTDFVGRVFKRFDEEEHVGDLRFNPEWTTYGAVDYGTRNPNVWLLLQVDPFGELVNVLGEVYERGLDAEQFAERIQERGLAPGGLRAFYPDPASPGDTSILEKRLKVSGMPHTGGALKDRLDLIRTWLKWNLPEGSLGRRPRLMFDRSCKETIRDFNDYRYPDVRNETDRNAPENPMKVNDHAPEALGRFFAGYFGTAAASSRTSRVRSMTVQRRR